MTMQTEFAALVGPIVGGRCYPVKAKSPPATPYIVYARVASIPQNDLDDGGGTDQLTNTRLQVNIYAESYGGADEVCGAVKAAVRGWHLQNTVEMEIDLFEDNTGLHHWVVDFSVWHS